ncbi:MAG: hypothetical protein WCI93_02770 [bacterium]
MFNTLKISNKKLSGRLIGEKALYSISFINSQMDWEEIPLLKKLVRVNYPTIDCIVGITKKYNQIKSSVVLRIFVNTPIASLVDFLSTQDNNFLKSENVNDLRPLLGALRLEGGDYEISKAENIFIGESKKKALSIAGRTKHGLEATSFSQNIFICMPSFLLIFNLVLGDEDEPKVDIIKSDFVKIVDSIKI